jgi:branched-chain amino acid transport system substrate-binding protein
MKTRSYCKMFVLFACICAGVGCESSDKADPTIKMGIVLPLTGTYGELGQAQLSGMNLAVDHFMADTGLTVEVPAPFDDETDPVAATNKAGEGAEKLIDQDEVVALIGSYTTLPVTAVAEVAEKRSVPYVTAGSISLSLAERGFNHFFRLTTPEGYVKGQIGFVEEVLTDVTRVAVLYDEAPDNLDWGTTMLAQLEASELEVAYTTSFSYTYSEVEQYQEVMTGAKAADPVPQAILTASNSYSKMVLALAAEWPTTEEETNPLLAFIGTWGLASSLYLAAAGEYSEKTLGTSPWEPGGAPERAKEMEQRVMADFQAKYKATPTYLSMLGYCQALVVLEACKRVIDADKSLTPANVTAEIRKTDKIFPIGQVVFDEVGDSKYYVPRVVQVQGGKFEVVYPLDVKTADAEPGVSW